MAVLATWFELRLADALQEARLAVERARLMTQPRAELVSRHIYAIALAELGRDAEALEVLEEGRRITRELEAWRFDAENLANIAEIRLRAGQVGEARSTIETALDIFRRAGMAYYGPIALANSRPDRARPSIPAQDHRRDRGASLDRRAQSQSLGWAAATDRAGLGAPRSRHDRLSQTISFVVTTAWRRASGQFLISSLQTLEISAQ